MNPQTKRIVGSFAIGIVTMLLIFFRPWEPIATLNIVTWLVGAGFCGFLVYLMWPAFAGVTSAQVFDSFGGNVPRKAIVVAVTIVAPLVIARALDLSEQLATVLYVGILLAIVVASVFTWRSEHNNG